MRVLVTRPQPAASRTAERLRAMGHEPVVLPLSKIVAVGPDQNAVPDAAEAVAITSANAIIHAPAELLRRVAPLPCYCVGAQTGTAALRHGFEDVRVADGDGLALANRLAVSIARPASILYLCGRQRRPELEAALVETGFHVTAVETYDTIKHELSPVDLADLAAAPVGAVLVYSPNSAAAIRRLTRTPGLEAAFAQARFLCLSARIAVSLDAPEHLIRVAAKPTEGALLALLGETN
jgi:uroporphyrinogen-III synthase